MALLELTDLRYDWGDTPCLDLAAFSLEAGESVFLAGASGSGKSTLINLIAGVLTPQGGTLRLLGHDLGQTPGAARDRLRADHIGLVFQQFNLIPYLSALDNVRLPCRFSARRRREAGDVEAAARQLLTALDLPEPLWRQPARTLSVGQQQRVAAARALIGAPELILADEPTSALDADRQTRFLDLLVGQCEASGAALLFVSHDTRLAARFDRTVQLAEINRAGAHTGVTAP